MTQDLFDTPYVPQAVRSGKTAERGGAGRGKQAQPWEMAPEGQVSAQEPQSMQLPASMTKCSSPWEIAQNYSYCTTTF